MTEVSKDISLAQRKIIQGVFIISTRSGEKINAMTAAWVSRASFTPPIITVSVGKTRYTHDLISASGVFAVHVLGHEHIAIGKHFGLKSGRKTDKFAGMDYETKATGSPIIKDCLSWMDCKTVGEIDAGDHTLFVGEVLAAGVIKEDGVPLAYERDSFYK
ncbi:MAG: flavin reductase family protein [Deltaproteobacteria bacterium]